MAARRPAFVPEPREVAAILEVPVAAFLPDVAPVIVDPDPRGRPLRYGAYVVEGRIVWGATAAILGQLGARCWAAGRARPACAPPGGPIPPSPTAHAPARQPSLRSRLSDAGPDVVHEVDRAAAHTARWIGDVVLDGSRRIRSNGLDGCAVAADEPS